MALRYETMRESIDPPFRSLCPKLLQISRLGGLLSVLARGDVSW